MSNDKCIKLNDQVIRLNNILEKALINVWGMLEILTNTLFDMSFRL